MLIVPRGFHGRRCRRRRRPLRDRVENVRCFVNLLCAVYIINRDTKQ